MELIEALKQLSLEVRNQEHRNISSEGSFQYEVQENYNLEESSHCPDRKPVSSQLNWQYPSSVNRHNQLREFDYSIDTLFAQISDLDYPKPCQNIIISPCRAQRKLVNSLETSQEEDSDCSSQQSGTANATYLNPLVEDLLRRDLSAITDTVRKISQILAIGNKIEAFWNDLTGGTGYRQSTEHDKGKIVDNYHIKTMCDTFASLLASEPHIKDLPTILRYNDYCNRLKQLNLLRTNNYDTNSDDDNIMEESDSVVYSQNAPAVPCSEEDDADAAFSEYNQLGSWTENRLYINNQPH